MPPACFEGQDGSRHDGQHVAGGLSFCCSSFLYGIAVVYRTNHITLRGIVGRQGDEERFYCIVWKHVQHIEQNDEKGYLRDGIEDRYEGGGKYAGCA